MSVIFFIMVAAGLAVLCFVNPEAGFTAMTDGAEGAITLSIKLIAIYSVWMGVLELMKKSGIMEKIAKAFRPITKKLFKGESETTLDYISLNLASNLLGMGGAATPLGLSAMENLIDEEEKPSKNTVMFTVINATSIQLIPATVIALRAKAGSGSPSDILIPTIIATAVSTITGIVLTKIFVK